MDWYQLYQEMFKTYMKSQENMWQSWESAMQDMQQAQSQIAWEQSVAMWETATMNMIDAHKRWLTMSMGNFSKMMQEGAMKAAYHNNWQMMIANWEKMQQTMWKNWFAMLKQAYPQTEQPAAPQAYTDIMEAWNEQAQKMMKMQLDWASQWMSATGNES